MKNPFPNEFQLESVKSKYITSAQKNDYIYESNQEQVNDNSMQLL